jgi:hypothetical protein
VKNGGRRFDEHRSPTAGVLTEFLWLSFDDLSLASAGEIAVY